MEDVRIDTGVYIKKIQIKLKSYFSKIGKWFVSQLFKLKVRISHVTSKAVT